MKPQSIKMFDYLYLGSLGLGIINFFLSREETLALLAADPATAQFGSGFMYGAFAFGMAISVLLWFLISQVRSKIAMWVLIALFVIGLLMTPGSLGSMSGMVAAFAVIVTAIQAAAIFFLFRPDAKEYLAKDPVDPNTFD